MRPRHRRADEGPRLATVAAWPVLGGKLATVNEVAALAVEGAQQVVRLDDAMAAANDPMWATKQGQE